MLTLLNARPMCNSIPMQMHSSTTSRHLNYDEAEEPSLQDECKLSTPLHPSSQCCGNDLYNNSKKL